MEKIKNIYNTATNFQYNPTDGRIYFNDTILLSSAYTEFNKIFKNNIDTVLNLKNQIIDLSNNSTKLFEDIDYTKGSK